MVRNEKHVELDPEKDNEELSECLDITRRSL